MANRPGSVRRLFLRSFDSEGQGSLALAAAPNLRRPADNFVGIDSALSLAEVYRSVQILVNSTQGLPLGVWRDGQELSTPTLIRQPDYSRSRASFIGRTVTGLALDGNSFWRVYRRNGTVTGVEVLNPLHVHIKRDDRQRKLYDVLTPFGVTTFNNDEVQHLRLLEIPDHERGLGPIQAARLAIRGAIDMRDYSAEWFSKSGVPTGVLTSDEYLDPQTSEEYSRAWHESRRDGNTAVLGKGLNYAPILIRPADAQFLETQSFTKTQLATLFGIPPTFLNAAVEGSNLTYSNAQQVNSVFWQTTLTGYLTEIADALSSLLPRGQEVRFAPDSLLRADDTTRIANAVALMNAGVISRDEVRAAEGFAGPAPTPAPAPAPVAVEPSTDLPEETS